MRTVPTTSFGVKAGARQSSSLVLLLFALGVLSPGAPAIDAQATGTMTVDFLLTDEAGAPVAGVTPGEISLRVGSRDLAVQRLEMITAGGEAGTGAGAPDPPARATAVPPPFGVTQPAKPDRRRNVLLLLDEGTLFGVEKIVTDSVGRLLGSLDPADRVALASTRPGGVNIGFTTNRDSIRTAIESTVMGRGNTALCVGALIDQVRGLAEALPRGRTTTLALISRGSGSSTSVLSQGPPLSGAGGCRFRREELPPVEEAVSAAQINYHVFHVGGTGLSPNLDNFAGATGAETGILSWTDADAIARAIQASSRFYRATTDALPVGGREYQRMELRVQRPGVKVRGPQHISNPKPAPGFIDAAALLRNEVSQSDLPLRLAAFASRNAGPQPIKLVVVVEPADAKATLTSAIVSVVGADGNVAGQWTARREDLARRPLVTAVPVAPGEYRVRAAAADEEGRGGIAEYAVSAALAGTGVVKLSAMALGVSTSGGFAPRLLFGSEPEVLAYLEAYDVPPSSSISAVFEIAAAPEGPVLATAPATVTAGNGVQMVIGALPLAAVPDGDAIVRARVTVDGVAAGTVVKVLRKTARHFP